LTEAFEMKPLLAEELQAARQSSQIGRALGELGENAKLNGA
jgi:hypothetical protein